MFEGERAYGGNIFKLRAHTERLIQSANLLGFDIPFSPETIDAGCKAVLAANGLTDAYIRPVAWRGSEQLAVSAQQTKIHLAIACWQWPNLFGADRMKGVTLGMATWRRPHPMTAPTAAKAAGLYMIGTLSKHAAEAEGFNDALMLTWDGYVSEATGANIFFALDGKLHTPTPDCFLNGITRQTVIALAQARQIEVIEQLRMRPGAADIAVRRGHRQSRLIPERRREDRTRSPVQGVFEHARHAVIILRRAEHEAVAVRDRLLQRPHRSRQKVALQIAVVGRDVVQRKQHQLGIRAEGFGQRRQDRGIGGSRADAAGEPQQLEWSGCGQRGLPRNAGEIYALPVAPSSDMARIARCDSKPWLRSGGRWG